jgi:hypothetical protein
MVWSKLQVLYQERQGNFKKMESEIEYNSRQTPFLWVLIQIAAIWVISDIGYYVFLPALGFGGGYVANPVQITIYYSFWLIFTLFSFWNIYKELRTIENRVSTYIFVSLFSIGIALYLAYVLPLFPTQGAYRIWQAPSDLLLATPWYFLPKSMDILLQQLLVVAMVLAFSFQGYSVRTISVWCAILFGGAHLLLVFGGKDFIYVSTFISAAVFASFVFPYLILKVKNGFVYSYFLHWLFYAVVIVLARVILI